MASAARVVGFFWLVLTVMLMQCAVQKEDAGNIAQSDSLVMKGEKHLRNLRMLTETGENAEAYFSFDGRRLIYQSTAGGYPCDQIMVMNTDGSGKRLVSISRGRNTCSYFLPGDSTVLFSSTYLAGSECPPPPDRSHGYVWQLYDTYDIFVADLHGQIIRRLTDTPGYDAEAVISPRGDKIVFTSTRDGDPEIYVMNLDGSQQTRLTHATGYDGGPFFSPDGSQIVFRASRPHTEAEMRDYNDLVKRGYVRPTTLEIYVMNADGSNIRQVTHLGKASFAPYFHPDGRRIIFASNVNSDTGRNFDLFMINVDGSGLEQITFNESFDGFPMFSADGKRLVFCSNRFQRNPGDTNVFLADWVE